MYKHGFPSYSLSVQWIWSCIDTYFLNIFFKAHFLPWWAISICFLKETISTIIISVIQ